jgi:hypothetical protein
VKKELLVIFFILFLSPFFIFAETKITIPDKIEYEGGIYSYSPVFKTYEIITTGNLDDDRAKKEVLISFGAYNNTDKSKKYPAYFIQIYKFTDSDKGYALLKTIKYEFNPGKIMLKDFNQDGIDEVAVFSHKEKHYAHIYIYQYQDGDYILIWNKGSYCGIEVDFEAEPVIIKVASSNLSAKILNAKGQQVYWCYAAEPLWEVYSWSGDTFSYRQDLSTAEPLKIMH